MPGKKAPTINLSNKQKQILEGLSKGTHTPLHLKQRASIVLMASRGDSNHSIFPKLKLSYDCVAKWRSRYAAASPVLEKTEVESPLHLRAEIIATLSDAPRSGKPPTFTQEQVASILAIACEESDQPGLPFSHWTPAL
ncbi:transposase [Robinsoniella peoriensis]